MTFLERIGKIFRFSQSFTRFEFSWAERHGLRDTSARANLERNRAYVFACASLNASVCANVPLRLYARGSTERFRTRALGTSEKAWLKSGALADTQDAVEVVDPEHPLLDLLTKANPVMTGVELRELKFLHQELTGNHYQHVETRSVGGRQVPVALWPLQPQYTRVVPDDKLIIRGYLYGKDDNNAQAYGADEIIHFRYPNPESLIIGMAPLEAVAQAADRQQARAAYAEALFANNARPDFLIKYKGQVQAESRRALYEDWDRRFKGVRKAGKPVILDQDGEIVTLAMTPRDAYLVEAADMDKAEIAAAFGVPLTLLEMSDSNKASAIAGETGYLRRAVVPRLMRDQAVLNEMLCPLFDGRLFVAYENPVPDDVALDVMRHRTYVQIGAMSVNEVRSEIGLEPIEGGDTYDTAASRFERAQAIASPENSLESAPKALGAHSHACTCSACESKALNPPLSAQERMLATPVRQFYRDWGAQIEARLRGQS
ncbi:MAG: phage portal protein [Armatimonadetes bacterium]|nr:phage portal protein [Armatimonadota bacterium]